MRPRKVAGIPALLGALPRRLFIEFGGQRLTSFAFSDFVPRAMKKVGLVN